MSKRGRHILFEIAARRKVKILNSSTNPSMILARLIRADSYALLDFTRRVEELLRQLEYLIDISGSNPSAVILHEDEA